jgi:diaminohydroxyphosphoribosylaminopyrimidine deaminase / 5-amino-6-(5-phosphoribosylamino)uracil reductase
MTPAEIDRWHLERTLELAIQGQGSVEPNPMVGCVIARGAEIIGEGWHRKFGGLHAEAEALRVAGPRAAGATMYVSLEPCCHHGKTPPCTDSIIAAGIRRVVAAMRDPFPLVAGGGLAQLEAAGIEVAVGQLEAEARRLNAPYLKLVEWGRPWVIAKWAMSLDGKIATHTGESQWISNEASRAVVHKIRGRVDAIIVGRETVLRDDPQLTARPAGPRTALRIVLDTNALLSRETQIVRTARESPVLVVVSGKSPADGRARLEDAGCEVLVCSGETHAQRLREMLDELGRRHLTNVLVEGGGRVLGSLLDLREIDEAHVFIAPKFIGGLGAPGPIAGEGLAALADALKLDSPAIELLDGDVYVRGRVKKRVTVQPVPTC